MSNIVHTVYKKTETKEYKITWEYDEYAESPFKYQDDHLFIISNLRRFCTEKKGFSVEDTNQYLDLLSIENYKEHEDFYGLDHYEDYHIFPVSVYIHSGVALSLHRNWPFDCPWDSSSNGCFLFLRKSDYETRKLAEEQAEIMIKFFNQYLSGDVYHVSVYEKLKYFKVKEQDVEKFSTLNDVLDYFDSTEEEEEWEHVMSVGGVYGIDEKEVEEYFNFD